MNVRCPAARLLLALCVTAGVLAGAVTRAGQSAPPRPANAFTVLARDGRQALPTTVVNGQEVVAVEDVARLFRLTAREDTLAGGLTISSAGKTLVFSTTQGLASAAGRLVSLSGPPVKQARGWMLPLDAISRALPLVLDTRIDVRRGARLIVVGDLRVPHIVVRAEPQGAELRVVLDITPATPHTVAEEPGRLLVRFQADALDATVPALPRSDVLSAVRVLDGAMTIALDLGSAFASYRASDLPAEGELARLAIDLLAATPAARPGAAPPTASATPPAEQPPLLFEAPSTAIRTIVLDPGHGGEETGAKGPGGTFEKDIALGVARQLKVLLESRLGVRVLLTRDADQTVPLDERAALANNNKADVFVSLHANASVREGARGAEVFYLSAGEYNAEARQQAAMEGELLPVVSGGERRVEMILWEMAQLQHLEDSSVLASIIEEALREVVPMSQRAIQQAPFRVLVGANMPAVLIEMGFVTNADEERQLAAPAHQALIAQAVYESLVKFRAYLEGGRRPIKADVTGTPSTVPTAKQPGASPPGGR